MASSLNHAIFAQIRTLVQSLVNRKTVKTVKNELLTLVSSIGVEAEKFMLQTLLESIDFNDPKLQSSSKDQIKLQFLSQRLNSTSLKDCFMDYFCQVIESVTQRQGVIEYVDELFKNIKP